SAAKSHAAPEKVEAAGELSVCPHCHDPRRAGDTYCSACGWIYETQTSAPSEVDSTSACRIRGRYELGHKINGRGQLIRFRALDYGNSGAAPQPVTILRAPAMAAALAWASRETSEDEGAQPDDGDHADSEAHEDPTVTEPLPVRPEWPSIGWESCLIEQS